MPWTLIVREQNVMVLRLNWHYKFMDIITAHVMRIIALDVLERVHLQRRRGDRMRFYVNCVPLVKPLVAKTEVFNQCDQL
ncbi:hypothetical protein D3C85_1425980 [compost metagenome]